MLLDKQIPAADLAVQGFGSAIHDVITKAKSGGTVLEDMQAATEGLVSAAMDLANLGAEIKKPSNHAFLVFAIDSALEPQAQG